MSILTQLIFAFSVIMLALIMVVSFFSYQKSSEILHQKSTQFLLYSINQMKERMDNTLEEYDKFSKQLAYNPVVLDYLTQIHMKNLPKIPKYELEKEIARQSQTFARDMIVQILDENENAYTAFNGFDLAWNSISQLKSMNWYPGVAQAEGSLVWAGGEMKNTILVPAVIGSRIINSWSDLKPIGQILIIIPATVVENISQDEQLAEIENIRIVDRNHRIVYSKRKSEIGQTIADGEQKLLRLQDASIMTETIEEEDRFIIKANSSYSGFTILSYVNKHTLEREMKQMQYRIITIGLIALAGAMLFVLLFSWSLSRPLRILTQSFQKIRRGILLPIHGRYANREVITLIHGFNKMVGDLDKAVKDLADKQISEEQAQLIALRAQFQPHFMYNTLNTIFWMLYNKGEEQASEMVHSLSEMLRYTIQPGSDLVPLKEDLKQLQRYIILQTYRYEDKLQVDLQVEDEILDVRVIRLLFQPLVENAIIHGLEPMDRSPGLIRILVFRDGGELVLSVEDNGAGVSENQYRDLLENRSSPNDSHTGLGLMNLNQRIKLVYKLGRGIELSKSELGGLKVTVRIPVMKVGE
ncbi:sensor histidine kinase [Paenibacillus sp. HWE-109]|uniref:sensor histidine kinase n=1 Tax=Paenibacillus sp. HWE-109 TaxID=1306526 RepID=UPI001EDF5C5C|nr:sensor histidine kinase [Paenibacillus sp. HWE-109]UKS31020.1 sensor histidine kinase [Paenibacillus sp. HWE-109]